ncbi:MAG: hypothetical protein KAX19_06890, partial [Candidatus Brocadiae bacterium]|nr:hypothetical protein [Candidatus Brocadiia bacterium]
MTNDTRYLVRRPDGAWCVRWGRPPTWLNGGREIRIATGTADLRKAQRFRDRYLVPVLSLDRAITMLRRIQRMIDESRDEARLKFEELTEERSGLTCGALVQRYIRFRRQGDYAPATRRASEQRLRAILLLVGEDTPVAGFDRRMAAKARDVLLAVHRNWFTRQSLEPARPGEPRLKPSTAAEHLVYARALMAWAVDEGLIESNPFARIGLPRANGKPKRAPTLAEARAMIQMPPPDWMDPLAWKAAIRTLLLCGIRRGMLSQITARTVQQLESVWCLDLRNLETKSANSRRLIPIHPSLQADLLALREGTPEGCLFGDPGDTETIAAVKLGRALQSRVKKVAPDL